MKAEDASPDNAERPCAFINEAQWVPIWTRRQDPAVGQRRDGAHGKYVVLFAGFVLRFSAGCRIDKAAKCKEGEPSEKARVGSHLKNGYARLCPFTRTIAPEGSLTRRGKARGNRRNVFQLNWEPIPLSGLMPASLPLGPRANKSAPSPPSPAKQCEPRHEHRERITQLRGALIQSGVTYVFEGVTKPDWGGTNGGPEAGTSDPDPAQKQCCNSWVDLSFIGALADLMAQFALPPDVFPNRPTFGSPLSRSLFASVDIEMNGRIEIVAATCLHRTPADPRSR